MAPGPRLLLSLPNRIDCINYRIGGEERGGEQRSVKLSHLYPGRPARAFLGLFQDISIPFDSFKIFSILPSPNTVNLTPPYNPPPPPPAPLNPPPPPPSNLDTVTLTLHPCIVVGAMS